MTYKSQFALLLFLILIMSGVRTAAQSISAGDIITLHIQDFCLIDTNHAPVNMILRTSVAGTPAVPVSNSDVYVKVSSVVPGATFRKMTVRISSGVVPQGTQLTLSAAPCTTANSGGSLGTVVSTPVALSSTDQIIVNNIASCYTGSGYYDGYRLTYTWSPYSPKTNYQLLQATASPVTLTVVLTISAHSGN